MTRTQVPLPGETLQAFIDRVICVFALSLSNVSAAELLLAGASGRARLAWIEPSWVVSYVNPFDSTEAPVLMRKDDL